MPELIEFWRNIEGVPRINLGNIVTFPKYCSPLYLKEKHIEEGYNRLQEYLKEYYINIDRINSGDFWKSPGIDVRGIENVRSVLPFKGVETREDPEIHKQMMEWIDFCLVARQNNEDIFELAPYLKEYKYANN